MAKNKRRLSVLLNFTLREEGDEGLPTSEHALVHRIHTMKAWLTGKTMLPRSNSHADEVEIISTVDEYEIDLPDSHAGTDFDQLVAPLVAQAISVVRDETQRVEQAGEDNGQYLYNELQREFLKGIQRLEELKKHSHEWNENGYCSICGADGNA